MDEYLEWESTVYPKLHAEALAAGRQAKEDELPRVCNLTEGKFIHNGEPLNIWRKIWEQGYDGWVDPTKSFPFRQMEEFVNELPTRPLTEDDINA